MEEIPLGHKRGPTTGERERKVRKKREKQKGKKNKKETEKGKGGEKEIEVKVEKIKVEKRREPEASVATYRIGKPIEPFVLLPLLFPFLKSNGSLPFICTYDASSTYRFLPFLLLHSSFLFI